MQKIISVRNLRKSYGEKIAVENLSFEVEKGEIFGLLGRNGAGKSTTIECILGTKKMDEGSVEVLGVHTGKRKKEIFDRIGVQFQETNYQDKIRVKEACEITYSLYKKPADWKGLLQVFGLKGKEKQLVSELSGGERQKLSVLQALIPNPELVFLDELTTGLDSRARRDVWKYLDRLKKNGLTILLTSHYMDEVEALCDRICILKDGSIIAMGTTSEIIQQSPHNTLEEAYLWYIGEEESEDEDL